MRNEQTIHCMLEGARCRLESEGLNCEWRGSMLTEEGKAITIMHDHETHKRFLVSDSQSVLSAVTEHRESMERRMDAMRSEALVKLGQGEYATNYTPSVSASRQGDNRFAGHLKSFVRRMVRHT